MINQVGNTTVMGKGGMGQAGGPTHVVEEVYDRRQAHACGQTSLTVVLYTVY